MQLTEKTALNIIFSQILVIFLIGIYAVSYSNPQFLMRGQDSDNQICGADPEVFDYPFVYFLNPTAGLTDRVTCVQQCPTPKIKNSKFLCHPNSVIKTCKPHLDFFEEKNNILVYESFAFMDNVCVPTVFQYYDQITNQIKPQGIYLIGHDMYSTRWFTFVFSIVFVFILNYLLLIILDHFPRSSIWIFLISTIGFFGIGGIYYAKKAVFAYNLIYQASPPLNSLQLSPEYIHVKSNLPDIGFNFFMSFLLILLFLISAKWVYDNFDEFENFFKNFEVVDMLLDEESSKGISIHKYEVRSLAIIFAALFSIVIGVFYFLFIYLISCLDRNQSPQQMNPFTKLVQLGFADFLLIIFSLSGILLTEFTFCCYKYVCTASLVFQIKKIRGITNLVDSSNTYDSHYVQQAVGMLFQSIPQIAKMSIINFITIIPSWIYYIIDMVDKNKLNNNNDNNTFYKKYVKYNFYTLSLNFCLNNYSYNEAMEDKRKILENEDDYDNFVDLISKPYLFSKSGQILSSVGLYSLLVLTMSYSYFNKLIYSNFVVSVVAGLIAYLITYLFLSYYQMSSETIYYMYYYEKAEDAKKGLQEPRYKSDEDYIDSLNSLIQKYRKQANKHDQIGEQN